MQRPRVEEGRCGGAETSTLVELIEPHHPFLAVLFLSLEKPHRNPHPEKLRSLNPLGLATGLVHDEIAVVERLDPKVIEIQVRGGIKGSTKTIKIETLYQLRADPLDRNPMLEIALELLLVSSLEGRCLLYTSDAADE